MEVACLQTLELLKIVGAVVQEYIVRKKHAMAISPRNEKLVQIPCYNRYSGMIRSL